MLLADMLSMVLLFILGGIWLNCAYAIVCVLWISLLSLDSFDNLTLATACFRNLSQELLSKVELKRGQCWHFVTLAWTMKKPWLFRVYKGWKTSQLYREYNKSLLESLLNNRFFFSWLTFWHEGNDDFPPRLLLQKMLFSAMPSLSKGIIGLSYPRRLHIIYKKILLWNFRSLTFQTSQKKRCWDNL